MPLIKPFIGLQSALLASNSILSDAHNIDYNKLVTENNSKNKAYLQDKKELLDYPNSLGEKTAELSLPVNLTIFDKYYTRLSEWKYLDKYTYDENILVFNSKEHTTSLKPSETFYQDEWLESLKHEKQYQYLDTNMSQYPHKDDSENINWISGGASSYNLRNLLFLDAPKKIESPFEMHKKVIELHHSHPMSHMINFFAGYWKTGDLNLTRNVLKEVNYGKLKKNHKKANEIYYDYLGNRKCDYFENIESTDLINLKEGIKEEGFDGQCDQVNLLNFWSFFYNRQNRKIFSSGYVGYKTKKPQYWNTQYYFYSLGNWILDKPSSMQVNKEQGEKNLWYVNFDNLFVPEVRYVPNSSEKDGSKKDKLQLSFYIDYGRIKDKDLDSFLTIASSLKYKLKFRFNASEKEVNFTLRDVLESKAFYFDDIRDKRELSDLYSAFSNFDFSVYSDNSRIKLSSKTGNNEFKFALNLHMIKSKFSIFQEIVLRQEVLKNFYFSELKKKQRLDELFYFVIRNSEDSEHLLHKLSKEWVDLLNVRVIGSDRSSSVVIKYFDFIEGKDKDITFLGLLTLPSFGDKIFSKTDKFTSLQDLISLESNQKIGNYFWDNVDLKLEEKNVLDGREEYSFFKKSHFKDEEGWFSIDSFKNIRIKVKDETARYLVPKASAEEINKVLSSSESYSSLFTLNLDENKELGLSLSDFSFRKIKDGSDFVEIEVEYKNDSSPIQLASHDSKYKDVKLKGKEIFKLNKKENYVSLSSQESSPSYFYNSREKTLNIVDKESSSFWAGKGFIPAIVVSAVAGGGMTAGVGSVLSRKLKFVA